MFFQDYHDDIRQEQMWEMQALSTTTNQDSLSSSGDLLSSDPESNTSDIILNNHLNNNNVGTSCDLNNAMQIDVGHPPPSITTTTINNQIQNGITIPTAVTGQTSPCSIMSIPNEAETQTVSLMETSNNLLHSALRGVKSVNIGEFRILIFFHQFFNFFF